MSHFPPLRAAVRLVLERPENHTWSIQGFGMLRTYLDAEKRWRLNIWHSRFAVPGVSIIHDHPWDFTSWVLCGKFHNQRYVQLLPRNHIPLDLYVKLMERAEIFEWATIKTGEGGGPDGDRGFVVLGRKDREQYWPESIYRQNATEIHASYYDDGTVTFNDRRRREDGEHARVFWPAGTNWVDAEPREATPDEVREMTEFALSRFGD